MSVSCFSRVVAALGTLSILVIPATGSSQSTTDSVAWRPLASRDALEAAAQRLQQQGSTSAALSHVRARLAVGDFRPGDLVLLEVQGDTALTDTFTVGPRRELQLPAPAVGTLSLEGVLRSELEEKLTAFIARFVRDPVVRARPLVRLSIQGEVEDAGYYGVPADAPLADAIMAAGGTTALANMKTLRIERDGRPILKGSALQRAIADGRTIDEVNLRGGDVITVDRRPTTAWSEHLRIVALVVSIAGGVYGLSRAF